ncbi:hypothetical protein D3C85_1901700 [compost metagenome]
MAARAAASGLRCSMARAMSACMAMEWSMPPNFSNVFGTLTISAALITEATGIRKRLCAAAITCR